MNGTIHYSLRMRERDVWINFEYGKSDLNLKLAFTASEYFANIFVV